MEQHLTDNEFIERCSKELKLSSIRDQVEDMAAEAAASVKLKNYMKTCFDNQVCLP